MHDIVASHWIQKNFGAIVKRLVNGGTPPTEIAAYWNGTIPWITGADFTNFGITEFRRFISLDAVRHSSTNIIDQGELLLVTRTGVGKLAIAPCNIAVSQDITGVYPDREQVDIVFLYYRMQQGVEELKKLNQGTSINGIIRKDLLLYPLEIPSLSQQKCIAEILSTIDEVIEQTEALIAKTRQIKAGLMHDLFTRGVMPDGQLRPPREEAPQLYKESPIGWIPREWDISSIGDIADSLIDGPFGSNLKSEHYIEGSGVRVVRLQNIQEGEYNDNDKVFISDKYATTLFKHRIIAGDILIAALGEDSYPVGRACCYPANLSPAINKADCFRLRCKTVVALNFFTVGFLNTELARSQIRRYEQGVTRRRINLGNIRRVRIVLPNINEQRLIAKSINTLTDKLNQYIEQYKKQNLLKRGLMQDLLTGKVRVPEKPASQRKETPTHV